MVDDRFESIIAQHERDKAVEKSRISNQARAQTKWQSFRHDWFEAYAPLDSSDISQARNVADRLVGLVPEIRERLWDYFLPEFARHPTRSYALASIILLEASFKTKSVVQERITRGFVLGGEIVSAHLELFSLLDEKAANAIPYIPPLNMVELSKVLGVSRDKLRGDIKAGRWTRHGVGDTRYKHKVCWKCEDVEVHREVLRNIRNNFPEKIWA